MVHCVESFAEIAKDCDTVFLCIADAPALVQKSQKDLKTNVRPFLNWPFQNNLNYFFGIYSSEEVC